MPVNDHTVIEQVNNVLAADTRLSLAERCAILRHLRDGGGEVSEWIDSRMIRTVTRLQNGLHTAHECVRKLQREMHALTQPALYPALFLRRVDTDRALVSCSGSVRVVSVDGSLAQTTLRMGDWVLLNAELNVLLQLAPDAQIDAGEVAEVERCIDASRLVLRFREERFVVHTANGLHSDQLLEGDLVRFDRAMRVAFERISRHNSQRFLVHESPDASFAQLGGHRRLLKKLQLFVRRICDGGKVADRYGLGGKQSILLYGPPGCGKTLMVRIVAAEMSRRMNQRFVLSIAKPAEWESEFVGATQARIRQLFETLREQAAEATVLLYLDEVEAVGRIRGGLVSHHSDKFLSALLSELDGFVARGKVVVVASTNRKDLLDPALLERLSDSEMYVPRPASDDARAILEVHLPESLPFSPNGPAATATRAQLIQHGVSRLYAPNAGNQLNRLKFRDGSTRAVHSCDLISGRVLEQICRTARHTACDRELEGGSAGICQLDLDAAIDDALQRMATCLTPANVRSYLPELPRDMDVIDVARLDRQAAPHRYLAPALEE